MRLFWREKGLERYGVNPKIMAKMEKAQLIVEKQLTRELLEKEKKMLPKLVAECVECVRSEGLKRVYKYNIVYFLQEKGIELSLQSRDILFNKVNFELKKNISA